MTTLPRIFGSRFPAALAALAGALGCESPDVFVPPLVLGGPAGVLEGTVTYTGPAPCIKDGRVTGAAILLAFDTRLLPPPAGLGTSAASIGVVSGDELFAGVRDQLMNNPDGCPAPGDPPMTVSATWAIAPLPAGTYQIRGFYDRDGDFDPGFKISNLPTQGDVGGGAILNAAEIAANPAVPPIYREITLGVNGVIPPQGARVSGIAVTLGLELSQERPVFHVAEVLDESGANTDPANVVMPSDYQLPVFSETQPTETEASFIRLRLAAGVPSEEAEFAAKSPFYFPVGEGTTPVIVYSREDVNFDGVRDAQDHLPESDAVPSLFPLSVFSKLSAGSKLVAQAGPSVVIQGITLYQNILSTALALNSENVAMPAQPEAIIALRPAALCLDVPNPEKGGVLVLTHETDAMGNTLIADPGPVEAALSARFGRAITLRYGCLPEGRYAMNLVYGTGQAWTVPNEAGVCAPGEEPANATQCGSRRRLASQDVVLTIGPPTDPAYCQANPTPAECGE